MIIDHCVKDGLVSDGDQQLARAGHGRIEQASVLKLRRRAGDAEDDGAVFAALGFVDGHGPGVLQLGEHIEAVSDHTPVIVDRHELVGGVNGADVADIAIVDADAADGIVSAHPYNIIIISDLHHPIAHSEENISEGLLGFPLRGGIQHRLQALIEGD